MACTPEGCPLVHCDALITERCCLWPCFKGFGAVLALLLVRRISTSARQKGLCAWSLKATETSCCAPRPTCVGHDT